MNPGKVKTLLGSVILGSSFLLSSCVEELERTTFMRYPAFWQDDMQNARMTLAPFKNMSDAFDAEREIRFNISKDLDNTHFYRLMDEASGVTNIDAFIENKRIAGDSDYVIYGILNDLKIETTTQQIDSENGSVERTTIKGSIKTTIEVYQVSDGMRLSNEVFEKQSHYENDNMNDRDTDLQVNALKQTMMTELASEITAKLVPTDTMVIYTRGQFINVSSKPGNKETTKVFSTNDTVYASILLPTEASHNSFSVNVVVKGESNTLFSHQFEWPKTYQAYNIEIPVSEFYVSGQKAYEARIIYDDNVIDYRRFTVE